MLALVTTSDPRYADPEIDVVADALRAGGVSTEVVCWDDERDWGAYELVLVRTPWDYFDRVVEFCDWAARVDLVTTLVNPADVIRWNSHKGYLVEMAARGVPTVPTVLIPAQSVDVLEQLAEVPWEDVVVKPAVDGGARQIGRGHRDSGSMREHASALATRGDVVVQPFLDQISEGERSLIFFGGALSHAVLKVPVEGDYRSQVHHGGAEHPHQPDSAELQVALAAMAVAPGELTYARVDLVTWQGSPALIELEVIEPDLFFRGDADRLQRFVAAAAEVLAGLTLSDPA